MAELSADTQERWERMQAGREPLLKLRDPFPPEQVGKLPRNNGRVVLDYVGHGAVTSRLLEVDPLWSWEPVATNEDGTPKFDEDKDGAYVGLWIRLTVCGVTRLGYGSVPPGTSDAVKQLIGDAVRNAAMRFGVALDLWIKGHVPEEDEKAVPDAMRASGRAKPSVTVAGVGPAIAEAFYKSAEKAGVDRDTIDSWAMELAGVASLPDVPKTHWNLLRDKYAVYLQEGKSTAPANPRPPFGGDAAPAPSDGETQAPASNGGQVMASEGAVAGAVELGSRAKKS